MERTTIELLHDERLDAGTILADVRVADRIVTATVRPAAPHGCRVTIADGDRLSAELRGSVERIARRVAAAR